jgi:hypothetical protein
LISPKKIPPFVSTDWCISCAQTQKEWHYFKRRVVRSSWSFSLR